MSNDQRTPIINMGIYKLEKVLRHINPQSSTSLVKIRLKPRPVWPGWVGVVPQSGWPLVQLAVGAYACAAGLLPSQGANKRQPRFFSHIDVSLPLFLSPFPSLKINE